MLILLGGFLGSGRKILARELVSAYGFHMYDMDCFRMRRRDVDKHGAIRERKLPARTDKERLYIYECAARDLPILAKMYDDVIIGRSFHRKTPREYFLAQVQKYFDPVIFVWIDSTEESALERIREMYGKKLVESIAGAECERERCIREFEPFAEPPLRYIHEGDIASSAERLFTLICSEAKIVRQDHFAPHISPQDRDRYNT